MSVIQETPAIDLQAQIATLAEMTPLEYDQVRKAKAKDMGIQLKTLDGEVEKARGVEDGDKVSQSDIAIALFKASGAVLFHDDQDMAFAEVPVDGHKEVLAIGSNSFKKWLNILFYRENGRTLREQSRKDAIGTLAGLAEIEGEEHLVHQRVAHYNGHHYIDLCDEQWRVVEIDVSGHRVLESSPVKFRRTATMEALPIPVQNEGNFEQFWDLVNVEPSDRPFLLVWMLEALRSSAPYPVLEIIGGHGTAKSTLHKFVRRLIDPSDIDLRGAPKSDENVWVAARNNHCLSFENMSLLKTGMQDVLCTVATGGGNAAREFHTNFDEVAVKAFNPTIINGINPVVTASDLSDRTIRIHLPKIEGSVMREESEIRATFEKAYQSIFSGLLDIFVKALGEIDNVKLKEKPRMVSYSILGEAVGKALGWKDSFNDNYLSMRASLLIEATQCSPVIMAISSMVRDTGMFYGTYKELLDKLDEQNYQMRGEKGTPMARGLSGLITRYEPGLSEMGFTITREAHSRIGSKIRIEISQPKELSPLSGNNVHGIHSGRKSFGGKHRRDPSFYERLEV